MKIAVVGTRGIPDIMGGIETHCQELCPRLVSRGAEVVIFGRKGYTKQDSPYEYRGVKIVPVATPRSAGMEAFVHTFRCLPKVWRMHPDIVHLHAIGPAFAAPFYRLIGCKVIYTHHGQDYNRAKWGRLAKTVLRLSERVGTLFSNRVIVISKYLEQWLQKKYGCKKTVFIRNGVNVSERLNEETSRKWLEKHGLQGKKYIFALGRFVEEKGFHDLIDAYQKADMTDVSLVIAGTADQESAYSRGLREKAKAAGVIMPGFIFGEELQAVFENASLFVIPSYHEGLPIALLEALSYNLDVIASDIPANTEVPLPEYSFYKTGDVEALAEKLKDHLKASGSQNYKKIVEEYYNWDVIADQTMEAYRAML